VAPAGPLGVAVTDGDANAVILGTTLGDGHESGLMAERGDHGADAETTFR